MNLWRTLWLVIRHPILTLDSILDPGKWDGR